MESSAESTAGSDSPRHSTFQDLVSSSVVKQRKQYRCPRYSCRHKRYPRKQDLIRHYCQVCCETCSITFVEASKYLNHKCAKASSIGKEMYNSIRMQVEEDLVSCNIQKHTSGGTSKSKPCPRTSEIRLSSHNNLAPSQHDLHQEDLLAAPVEGLNYNAGIDLPLDFTAQHPLSTSFPTSASSEFQARYTYLAGLFDSAPGSGQHPPT
ncbi:hypothetical protein IF1G_10487 [Cordyceps javanica]|uniref:Uncharacterized protein n=1 Tax=Cordyceps javanica TaxID=43265 RepID=A0A545UMQ5_9HYPO|nr:hypothetical protein IF1G_10487 [Cordyceps javanica]